ncbi:MAG: ABC transporter ATP-binding protein [Kiritimatiellae bacterium]|nr:ABC transporter ATP-binding protein [Kiritimatiellia bacterium]MDD5521118.1 ABC transporter ATP-binding protein [Kiritimatiellia bacterium]
MAGKENNFAVIANNLEKKFGSFVAVNRINLKVSKGEIFGFLGPNGAGKSTTIKILCGILTPTSGQATVSGFDVGTEPEEVKANIGYMSQKFSLYDDLTVEENIDFYSGIYCIPQNLKAERKKWVLDMAGLQEHKNSICKNLSSGWKQRLALGCAIIHEPPILFLDEPTSGVDPISRRQFWDLIYQLAEKGVTIFVTTHYMEEAEYCDRIGLIYRGELIAIGTPGELKTNLMPEDILEVQCERPHEAMEIVEKLQGIKEASLFGRGIHVVSSDSKISASLIQTTLTKEGFHPTLVEQIIPSLEDVFVSLIEACDRQDNPQTEVTK